MERFFVTLFQHFLLQNNDINHHKVNVTELPASVPFSCIVTESVFAYISPYVRRRCCVTGQAGQSTSAELSLPDFQCPYAH